MAQQAAMEEPEFTGPDLQSTALWHTVRLIPKLLNYMKKVYLTKSDAAGYSNRFMLSDPDVPGPLEEGTQWEPARSLGAGSFGRCGVWHRLNDKKDILDAIVIKEVMDFGKLDHVKDGVLLEASVQRDLQRRERQLMQGRILTPAPQSTRDRHIVHLRGYKYNTTVHTCRLYMEHAQWGTLQCVFDLYEVHSAYLPEVFLWHCLAALADACVTMASTPHESTLSAEHWKEMEHNFEHDNWFTLHLDIKPENVYLAGPGNPTNSKQLEKSADYTVNYPRLVVGDYGFSVHTSVVPGEDDNNPAEIIDLGTDGWYPPEQHTDFANNCWDDPLPQGGRPISAEANIWQVGKCIFDLMHQPHGKQPGGVEGQDWLHAQMRALDRQTYENQGNHVLPPDYTAGRNHDYSDQLKIIVRQCLSLRAEDRPAADHVRTRALEGLQRALDATNQQKDQDSGSVAPENPRVYFKKNEINLMPSGNGKWRVNRNALDDLRQDEDPDYPYDLPRKGRTHLQHWRGRKAIGNLEVFGPNSAGDWIVSEQTRPYNSDSDDSQPPRTGARRDPAPGASQEEPGTDKPEIEKPGDEGLDDDGPQGNGPTRDGTEQVQQVLTQDGTDQVASAVPGVAIARNGTQVGDPAQLGATNTGAAGATVNQGPAAPVVNAQPNAQEGQVAERPRYGDTTIEDMKKELKFRKCGLPTGGAVRKRNYVEALQAADLAGNTGRGAYQTKRRR